MGDPTLQALIDDGDITVEQATYMQRVMNNNPRYVVEFTVCDHGGVIMEVFTSTGLRQRGTVFGVRRDGSFVENDFNPDWRERMTLTCMDNEGNVLSRFERIVSFDDIESKPRGIVTVKFTTVEGPGFCSFDSTRQSVQFGTFNISL